jgi:hypothetical protein
MAPSEPPPSSKIAPAKPALERGKCASGGSQLMKGRAGNG